MKTCFSCKETKDYLFFDKRSLSKDGYRSDCKECHKKREKDRDRKRKEKIKEHILEKVCSKCKKQKKVSFFTAHSYNKDGYDYYCKECNSSIQKEYRILNREKKNKYSYHKKRVCPQFKLQANLRSRLHKALKSNIKTGSAIRDLGCSIEQLKEHIEKQWQEGMSWDNWTPDGWHIDHIKPLSKFDLTDRNQSLEANHYTNLQPLWAHNNLSKGTKTYYI